MVDDAVPHSLANLSGILGFDSRGFLSEVFGRQPLHVPGANAAAYRELVTLREIDAILASPSTRPPYVRLIADGELIDPQQYSFSGTVARRRVNGLLDHALVMDQFDRGVTIVLDSIQHWLPAMRELCASLQRELGTEGWATVFASPPGEQALQAHADSYEIFVLQIAGTKKWSLYPRLEPVPPAGASLSDDDLGPEEATVVLNPGDLLYLPWGTPHVVTALENPSVHVSVALRPPTWEAVIQEMVRSLISDGREHEPVLMCRGRENELGKEMSTRLARLVEDLGAIDASAYTSRLIAEATEDRRRSPGVTLAGLYPQKGESHR
ncbi:hypothetical protein J3S85_31050 [Streptomyces lavenduligriseus]|nr:hypothetical protein J3S85_31050 [Streptomyces lavenduligriseus]